MVMRLQALRLAPYGCFADQEVEFAPRGTVDLVVGANAAGKSTMTRGTLGLFFGIDQRTPDAHSFPYPDLRIGARVELGEREVEVVRRKGRVGTLTTPDGEPLADDLLATAFGGLTKDVFHSLFMIDNPSLKQGAAELLQGKGEVGASLFAAAAGIANLHSTVERFDREARDAFNPGARKDPVHNALRDLRDAEKRQRDATLRPPKHREMERELEAHEAECEELRVQLAGLEAEREELRRKRMVAPLLARHSELSESIQALGELPELFDDARPRRTAAEEARRSAERRFNRAREKDEELKTNLEAVNVDEALLSRAGEVRAAHQQVPVVAKATGDRPRRSSALATAEERLRASVATAGIDRDEVEELRRPEPARRRLDDAIQTHARLVERRRAADEARAHARQRHTDAETAAADTDVPKDMTTLAAVAKAARGDGALEAQEREARAEAERLARDVEAQLARLRPTPASIEQLASAAVPPPEAVTAALEWAERLADGERGLQADKDRLQAEREELQQHRDQLELGVAVPTGADLTDSRGNRQFAWDRLRPALEGEVAAEPGAVREYESRLVEADALADAQVAGAAQLAIAARLKASQRKLGREAELLAEREHELAGSRETLAAWWSELWASVGFYPPELDAATPWLERRERVLQLGADADRQVAKARALAEGVDTHHARLQARLSEQGVKAPDASFAELLELADQVLDDAATRALEHEGLARELTQAKAALGQAEAEATASEKEWEGWKSAWPRVLEAAGLPSDATPESALQVARAVADSLEELARISELRRSVEGIDRDRSQFESDVQELCSSLAPELSQLDAAAAVADLTRRLRDAEVAATTRSNLLTRRAELNAELEDAQGELQEAEDDLEELRRAGECDLAELPALEDKCARARELGQELHGLERQAVEVGTHRFDQLMADLSEFNAEAAAARQLEIEEHIEELTGHRDDVKTTLGERKAELRAAESDLSPVEAAEDAELAKAELEQAARAHAHAKLAAVVVRRAMERYRRLHQDPLLKRANAMFARFTLGSFVELFVDHEPGTGAILMGRQRDRQLKKVEQMSTGTREQLFLALRIAAIERYVSIAGAVPVIFDDAFLESDEKRAAKVFEALAELAKLTQVIVLTHRSGLAELGRQVLGERLSVVELPDAAPTLRAADAAEAA
jgi:uncharacterized protein YhaN